MGMGRKRPPRETSAEGNTYTFKPGDGMVILAIHEFTCICICMGFNVYEMYVLK
jgi:hypothetical protein